MSIREAPEARQGSIIEATMACIAAYGYAETTIDRICKQAGISRGLINHHFSTKDELMAKTYHRLADHLALQTRRAVQAAGDEPEGALRALICASFQPDIFEEEHLAVWLGFWSVVRTTAAIAETHRALYAGYRRALTRAFERVQEKQDLTRDGALAATTLTALIDGFWLERALDPQAFSAAEARRAALMVAERFLGQGAVIQLDS